MVLEEGVIEGQSHFRRRAEIHQNDGELQLR